jgi:hypothetical protein
MDDNTGEEEVIRFLNTLKRQVDREESYTFQNALYMYRVKDRLDDIDEMLKDQDDSLLKLIHIRSIRNDTAGKWLQSRCRFKQFELSNIEYSIGLCFRYFEDIPFIHDLEFCPFCGKHDIKVDKKGQHFISGCKKDIFKQGRCQPHAIHDDLRDTLLSCAKHSCTWTRPEPKNLLADGLIPDIQIKFPRLDHNYSECLVDLAVVSPFEGVSRGILQLPNSSSDGNLDNLHKKRAERKANEKRQKYKQAIQQLNRREVKLVPFVISNTGAIHKDGMSLLNKLADHSSEFRRIPKNTLLNFYLKMISLTFIRSISRTIHTKAISAFSGNFTNPRANLRKGNLVATEVGDPDTFLFNSNRSD